MNDAHLHLIVNHFPIIATIIGTGILAAGFLFKSEDVRKTAFVVLIISALSAYAAVYTGENAEDIAKKVSDSDLIHDHEEIAEKFALFLYVVGGFSLVALVLTIRKSRFTNVVSIITMILGIAAAVISREVGTTGGEIIHSEIRDEPLPKKNIPAAEEVEIDENDEEGDDGGKGRGRNRGRSRD